MARVAFVGHLLAFLCYTTFTFSLLGGITEFQDGRLVLLAGWAGIYPTLGVALINGERCLTLGAIIRFRSVCAAGRSFSPRGWLMDPATITAVVAALASTVGLLVTSLRKRQDTTVEELRLKARTEQEEHNDTKEELRLEKITSADLRRSLRHEQDFNVQKDRKIFILRRLLAQNGINDPTYPDAEDTVWGKSPPDLSGKAGNDTS